MIKTKNRKISWKELLNNKSGRTLEEISVTGRVNETLDDGVYDSGLIFSIQPLPFYEEGEINTDALVVVRLKCQPEIPEITLLRQLLLENKRITIDGDFSYQQQENSDVVGVIDAYRIRFNE